MSKEIYSFTLKTPHGSAKGEADSLDSLASLLPAKIASKLSLAEASEMKIDLEATAQEVLDTYRARYEASNRHRSRIAGAGLELDLVKCYLRGLTAKQAIEWFKAERGFATSKSAIGRYWTTFCDMGIVSLRKKPILQH